MGDLYNLGPARRRKLLDKALAHPRSMRFAELVRLVEAFRFRLSRVKGSHHIFVHPEAREIVNLQNASGMAKPYQVRQFVAVVKWYNLKLEDREGPGGRP